MERVLASATVDVLTPSGPLVLGFYRIEVWGQPPHDVRRVYKIYAKDETRAAQEGIQRFVDEMEALPIPGDGPPC